MSGYVPFATAAAPDGVDSSPYTPSKTVEDYYNGPWKDDSDHLVDTAMAGIAVIVVGGLMWLFLVGWNCCSVCCWRGGRKEHEKNGKIIAATAVAVSALAVLISFVVAMAAVEDTKTFLLKIPKVVDYTNFWHSDTVGIINHTEAAARTCGVNAPSPPLSAVQDAYNAYEAAKSTAGTTFIDILTEKNALVTGYTTLATELGTLRTELGNSLIEDSSVEDLDKMINNAVDGMDNVSNAFTFMLLLVLVQCGFAIANLVAPDKYKPRKLCWCCIPLFTWIYLIVFLLVWILAYVFFVTATYNSNFCFAFDENMLTAAGSADDETMLYYTKCDENTALANPLADELEAISDALTTSDNARSIYIGAVEGQCAFSDDNGNACTSHNVLGLHTTMNTSCSYITRAITDQTEVPGRYDLGTLMGQVDCTAFNNRIQAFAHLVCDDTNDIWAKYSECLIAIGIFMFIIEVVRKETRGQSAAAKQKSNKVGATMA